MRLEARTSKPAQLFEDIAHQMFRQIIDPEDVGEVLREKIAVEGESLDHLLREWIRALLDIVRVQKMIFNRIQVTLVEMPEKGPYRLQAEAIGELLDPVTHVLAPETANLSCRDVRLHIEGEQYCAEVLLNK